MPLYAPRAYVGRAVAKAAVVDLSDPQGRPRVRPRVDSLGSPSLEFLDESGRVTTRLPEPGRRAAAARAWTNIIERALRDEATAAERAAHAARRRATPANERAYRRLERLLAAMGALRTPADAVPPRPSAAAIIAAAGARRAHSTGCTRGGFMTAPWIGLTVIGSSLGAPPLAEAAAGARMIAAWSDL